MPTTITARHALLADGWAENVAIEISDLGTIDAISRAVHTEEGCLLPGIANLHSHAHQRAMAGLAERSGGSADSFWSWRTTMYQFLDAIGPEHLYAIARQLYVEMLKAGYTRVAEFQYLHHAANGRPYENTAEMSLQTLAAAVHTGLGITNLPVLYGYGGFGGQDIVAQQRRFFNTPGRFLDIVEALKTASSEHPGANTGIAAHSLRAVTKASLLEVLDGLGTDAYPLHIHIAEQTKEVDDCLAWCGRRPVAYLYEHFQVNSKWCLIHATQMTDEETRIVAKSGAVAGLCPTTEANLGDGFFNATPYLHAGGAIGIGSDSHISISPTEELRWLEYGQRLVHQSRNQLAGGPGQSTGRRLFELAAAGGAQACGHNAGALAVGMCADMIRLDTSHPLLCAHRQDEIIDSWIFSGNENLVRDVYVGGRKVVCDGHHESEEEIAREFAHTMQFLRAV